jgi:tetratricopeptide (TPR) repeat protein
MYRQLATLARAAGRSQTAQELRRAAIRSLETLVAESPQDLSHATALGGEYVNLGLLLTGPDQSDEALSWLDRAVDLLDQTHAKWSEAPAAKLYCRNAHLATATRLEELQRYASAAADWEITAKLDDGPFRQTAETNRLRCLTAAKGLAEKDKVSKPDP